MAARLFAESNRLGHEAAIVRAFGRAHIPSWFSSFWNCRCRSFCAASFAAWSFFWSAMISASVRFDASPSVGFAVPDRRRNSSWSAPLANSGEVRPGLLARG